MFKFGYKSRITKLKESLREKYDAELDTIRCRIDMDDSILDDFIVDRKSQAYQQVFTASNPLVSVCIATYNRCDLLLERTIPSVLQQTYRNIELVIVGDCCQDATAERVGQLDDPRVKFVNLPERGRYPDDPMFRWMVAGTTPVNHALGMATGDFITHLDDDDRFPLDRIEKLLRFTQENRYDFVWHPFYYEKEIDKWLLKDANDFAAGQVTTSSVFYHRWFRRIGWDINAYRLKEPGDWNRFRKFRYLGVNAARFPEPMLYHYKERNQRNG